MTVAALSDFLPHPYEVASQVQKITNVKFIFRSCTSALCCHTIILSSPTARASVKHQIYNQENLELSNHKSLYLNGLQSCGPA